MDEAPVIKWAPPHYAVPLYKPARYKGLHGGRGGSKSWTFADLLLFRHAQDGSTSSVCLREIQLSIKESVKRLLERRIIELKLDAFFDVKDTEIRNRHGTGKIIFSGLRTHTADSIKSLEAFDIAWIEEAQTVSQRSLDILRPTMRKDGSEIWFSWNPDEPNDAVEVLLRGKQPPEDAVIVEVNYFDNPDLPDTLRKEMEYDRARDPDKFAHVWLGKYRSASEARVFKHWSVAEKDFEAPAGASLYYGADWGFSHASALVRCWIDAKRLYVDYEAVATGLPVSELPALFRLVPDSERWTIIADSNAPQINLDMRKAGFRVVPALKGPKSVEQGIEFLKSYDIVVSPRCTVLINELVKYSYRVDEKAIDPRTGRPLVTPDLDEERFHPDVIHALRYAVESVRRGIGAVKTEPRPNTPAANHWGARR